MLSKAIKDSRFPESKIAFQSSKVESLLALKEKHPKEKYNYISKMKNPTTEYDVTEPKEIKHYLSSYGVNRISLKGRRFLDKEFFDELKKDGMSVYVWTINDISRAKFYSRLGVSGIITDNAIEVQRANKSIQPTANALAAD